MNKLFRILPALYVYCVLWIYIYSYKDRGVVYADAKRIAEGNGYKFHGYSSIVRIFINPCICYRDVLYWRLKYKCHLLQPFFPKYVGLLFGDKMEAEGGAFFFYHPFSTIINAAFVGYGCTFRNNTTVGNKIVNGVIKKPILKGFTNVGPNSCIIGGITISKNVMIGAGSVVVKDVAENTVVAGNPARTIRETKAEDVIDAYVY